MHTHTHIHTTTQTHTRIHTPHTCTHMHTNTHSHRYTHACMLSICNFKPCCPISTVSQSPPFRQPHQTTGWYVDQRAQNSIAPRPSDPLDGLTHPATKTRQNRTTEQNKNNSTAVGHASRGTSAGTSAVCTNA